jgi:hypothetical protein
MPREGLVRKLWRVEGFKEMKRTWFQDDDGTYYRNIPLILGEIRRAIWCPWRWHRLPGLWREWDEAWGEGLIGKPHLGRGDRLGMPVAMREACPDEPELRLLDAFLARREP